MTLIAFATLIISGVAKASLVVIANSHSPIPKLDARQLAALYLNQPVSIKVSITPYNQPDNSPSFLAFYQQILAWGPDQFSSYWAQQVFSGFSQKPPAVASDQEAIQVVEQNPNAIAYVDSRSLKNVGDKIKVIYGHYVIPKKPSLPRAVLPDSNSNQLYGSTSTNGYMTALSDSDPASDASTDTIGFSHNPDTLLAQELTTINQNNESQSSQNIWPLIASQMKLQNEVGNPAVHRWISWFQHHPGVLKTMIDNASPYLYYVYQQTQRRHMPAEFALLPMIESGYNPRAYSSAGAAGLWQLMPDTASNFHMAIDWWYDTRRDVLTSTNAGLNFLVYLHNTMHTWNLAAAAYNVGPGALAVAIHRNQSDDQKTDFWDLLLPKQTENYVPKLLAISAIIANPKQYGIHLPYIPNRPFFSSVTLTSQMDLQDISTFSDISIPVIKALNPGLQRWATAPEGHFTLLLPITAIEPFTTNLEKVVGKQHLGWKYKQVASDDTLKSIAIKNHTTVAELEKINHLHSEMIKQGQGILVPVPDGATYTNPINVANGVQSIQNKEKQILSNALSRAAKSQEKALPAEVTGEPIKASDDLKSLLGKLYGSD